MEAIVVNAWRVRKFLVDYWLALMVDEVEYSLFIDTSRAFRENPSFLILRWYDYLSRKAIEVAALLFFNSGEAGQTVAVR